MSATLNTSASNNQTSTDPLPMDIIVHLQDYGDKFYHEGDFAGTRGEGRRVEGFQLTFHPPQKGLGMQYMAHLEDIGDVPWVSDGQFVGTRGEARRLEGFAIKLTGDRASQYTVQYFAHLGGFGDSGWFMDGQFCGTRGQSRRVEGICVKVVRK
ncbi:MAG: hypothetical protein EHM20_01180 [Alphaproteobacteria bacterium]|nr:MAG: hypothetical protein EHM20_01180 [Alphaproteobacteria bacterium]